MLSLHVRTIVIALLFLSHRTLNDGPHCIVFFMVQAFSADCVPAVSLVLHRCLDTSPKVNVLPGNRYLAVTGGKDQDTIVSSGSHNVNLF